MAEPSKKSAGVEFLSDCWVSIVYLKSRFFYAYGNTSMEDFLEDLKVSDTVDVLQLGAGDVRHVLKTVAGINARPQAAGRPKTLRFHLNDVDNEVIARDIILLEIISSIDSNKMADVEYLWDVWYNMTLTEGHYERLKITLERLVGGASSPWWSFGDKLSRKNVLVAWKHWLEKEPWNLDGVKASRKAYTDFYSGIRTGHTTICAVPQTPFCKDTNSVTSDDGKYLSEWNEFYVSGIARDFEFSAVSEKEFINPTLMRPESDLWHVHYGINPLSAYLPLDRSVLDQSTSLTKACLKTLQSVIQEFKIVMSKITVRVAFSSVDAFVLCHARLPPETKFDVIHTSNMADHVGLLNLLVTCERRLKNCDSILVTESFRWAMEWQKLEDHILANICCKPLMLPTLLGLRLASDFDIGSSTVPSWLMSVSTGQIIAERIQWTKCLNEQTISVSLKDCPDVVEFLTRVVDLCFPCDVRMLFERKDGRCAVTALALVYVLKRLQHLVVGGMKELLSFVDDQLGARKSILSYKITWDALCAVYGLRQFSDEVVVVRIPFKGRFPSKTSPNVIGYSPPTCLSLPLIDDAMMMAAFMSQRQPCFTSEIFRTYMFDAADESFHIPMLRSVLDDLTDGRGWMMWMSETLNDPFQMPTCFRMNASVVQQFRGAKLCQEELPAKTFSSSASCREFDDRYEIELKLDNNKQKLKLDTEFLPADSLVRTALKLTIRSPDSKFSRDITWNFSCCLVPSKSKFQIGSKTGFVRATLRKDAEYYNAGRTAAPLRRIDDSELVRFSGPSDVEAYMEKSQLLKAMFMSARCLELRQQANNQGKQYVSDPFFCLRQTIESLWEESYKHPKMKTFTYRYFEDKDSALALKGKIDLLVRGYYLYRSLPFIRLTFIDTEKALRLLLDGVVSEPLVRGKRTELIPDDQMYGSNPTDSFGIACITEKEHHLTRRLLVANSLRLRQDQRKPSDNDWYCETFLQMHFCRQRSLDNPDLFSDIIGKQLPSQRHSPSFSPQCLPTGATGLQSFPDGKATENSGKTDRRPVPVVGYRCAHCSQPTTGAKCCGICRKAYYCNRECQKADWPKHKINCTSQSASEQVQKTEVQMTVTSTETTVEPFPMQNSQNAGKSGPKVTAAKIVSCASCGNLSPSVKSCSICHKVWYCNRDCQKADWPKHKINCTSQSAPEQVQKMEAQTTVASTVEPIQMQNAGKSGPNKVTIDRIVSCASCGNLSPSVKSCSTCHKVWYCDRNCQKADWPKHKSICASHSLVNEGVSTMDLTCSECRQPSENLKKCARCHSVSYCSKECQRAAWPQHKNACK